MVGFIAGIIGTYIFCGTMLPFNGGEADSVKKTIYASVSTILGFLGGLVSIKFKRSDIVVAGAAGSLVGVIFTRPLRLDVFITNTALLITAHLWFLMVPVLIFICLAYMYKDKMSFEIKIFTGGLFIILCIEVFTKTEFTIRLPGFLNSNLDAIYSSNI
jgi:hypothetical protein